MEAVPVLMMVAFVGVGVLLFVLVFAFSRDNVIRRKLRAVQSTPIAEVGTNRVVKICGQARKLERTLRAPLTDRECVYYHVIVEQYRSSGESGSWHQVISESNCTDFLVDDSTGVARVNVHRAEAVLVHDAHFKSGTWNDAAPELEKFLERHGEQSTGLLGFNKKLRYKEGVLELGERVAVLGASQLELDTSARLHGGYRRRPERPVLSVDSEGQLLLSDDPTVIDLANRQFVGPASSVPRRAPCPNCGAHSEFRSFAEGEQCLACGHDMRG